MDKDFETVLQSIGYGVDLHTAWNDFVTLASTAIANAFDFQRGREEQAKTIMKKYQEKDMERFSQLFALLVDALEKNPRQDYLGEMFMDFGFGNSRAGQYFTPYHVAELMARITIGESSGRPYDTINDPTCGSGVMLIAAADRFRQLGRNPATEVLMVGQDISYTIAMMCYIQLSLLGVAGYVVVGNSLTEPLTGNPLFAPEDAWCTPMYFHPVWWWRRMLCGHQKGDSSGTI